MPIAINYQVTTAPGTSGTPGEGYDSDDYGDACSVLVPLDVVGADALREVTAGGTVMREDPTPVWSPTATYSAGERVHVTRWHRVYECAMPDNIGKDPSLPMNRFNAAGATTWWIEVGPTNKYAMFDGMVTSQTVAPSPLVITMTPGAFNGFALFGVDADSFSVEIRDMPGGTVVYSETGAALEGTAPSDHYEYFFERFKPLRQFIRAGLEPYASGEVTLALHKPSGEVRLGMLAIGDLRPIGIPQRDAVVEPQDFSYFKQDAFGNATVQRRTNATGMSISTKMDKADAGTVLDTIKEVLGVPVVVVGSEHPEFGWLTVFGLISGRMSPANYPFVTLNITVKGFI